MFNGGSMKYLWAIVILAVMSACVPADAKGTSGSSSSSRTTSSHSSSKYVKGHTKHNVAPHYHAPPTHKHRYYYSSYATARAPIRVPVVLVPYVPSQLVPVLPVVPLAVVTNESVENDYVPLQGKFSFSAERTARNSGCVTDTLARMNASGPGFETYSVACNGGDVASIRCDFGNCRVLK